MEINMLLPSIIAAAICLILIESHREQSSFVMRHYTIVSDKLKAGSESYCFVLLADLHGHIFGKDNASLAEAVLKSSPDAVLVAGDMITAGNTHGFEAAEHLLSSIALHCPVYYGLGNHEMKMEQEEADGREAYFDYRKRLEDKNIRILSNKSDTFQIRGQSFTVSGLTIPGDAYSRVGARKASADFIREMLGEPAADGYQILIAHNPAGSRSFSEWGADLTVSGHYHGGIVRFFGKYGLITPQFQFFSDKTAGCFANGKGHLVISSGLGTHFIPIRLGNPAEAVFIHLRPEKENEKAG